jgi:hypothetical protein
LSTDFRKPIYAEGSVYWNKNFGGDLYGLDGNINYRFRQYMLLSLRLTYNKIMLPAPYKSADLLLIGPRMDITFTRNLFWTTFVQYNNQINNVNVNTRLQWRFKPVSDFFLVYTDNYFADQLNVKNRALVLKLTYWFNI